MSDRTFEEAMEELIHIVEQLEEGGLPLETTLTLYERGQALAAACNGLLDEAQLRVDQLRQDGGLQPLEES